MTDNKTIKINDKEFTLPTNIWIGNDEKKLYTLEDKRSNAVRKAAKELAKVLEHEEKDFYSKTYPQALFDILTNYEKGAAIAAAKSFLEIYNFKITGEFKDPRYKG